jgi:catechol 2,3-dioxygenase-like lactoylglutathione lyase family enzyme
MDHTGSTLDHLGIAVSDAKASAEFYKKALEPLGISLMFTIPPEQSQSGGNLIGFGHVGRKPFFWLHDNDKVGTGTHIAFHTDTREAVDAFYQAALAAGGQDDGPPGIRPKYHENYYGAFVLDRDGINVEAVCHKPI